MTLRLIIVMFFLLGCSSKSSTPIQTSEVPSRIISLAPNLTEVLVEIGEGSRLIGASRFDREEIDGRPLPKVGGIVDPSVEQMVALNPDLVLLHRDGAPPVFVAQLESVGIPVFSCGIKDLEALKQCIVRLGKKLDAVEPTQELLVTMQELFKAPPTIEANTPTIMLVLNESPLIVASRQSFPAQVARLAGWRTLPEGDGPDYPRLSLEQLAAARPTLTVDLVMGENHNSEAFQARLKESLGDIKITQVDPDKLLRPGPELLGGLLALRLLSSEVAP
jgi:iron complex transport system substrate-binding protein